VRVGVRVPATSANLGAGFDCFGLALDVRNEATVDTEAAPGVSWQGEGADELPTDGSDMVTRAMRAIAERMRILLPAFALRSVNEVPLERGLGSSSAAAVAGVMLASGLLDLGIHADPYSVFSLAAEIEGHPDNAAAAVYRTPTSVRWCSSPATCGYRPATPVARCRRRCRAPTRSSTPHTRR
jgi:homoserine kinase